MKYALKVSGDSGTRARPTYSNTIYIVQQCVTNYKPEGHMWPTMQFLRPSNFLSILCWLYVTVGNFS